MTTLTKKLRGALRGMERDIGAFRAVFKSITADNRIENLDVEAMEASAFSSKKHTQNGYVHPYSSWERISDANGSRMIRRFILKGTGIADYIREEIKKVENWMNTYSRKIPPIKTAGEMFNPEMAA